MTKIPKYAYTTLMLFISLTLLVSALSLPVYAENSEDLKEKSNRLYEEDPEFREAVDRMREMIWAKDAFSDEDWREFRELFNKCLVKLGLKPFSDEDFEKFKGLIEEAIRNTKILEEQRKSQSSSVTPSNIGLNYLPYMIQPSVDVVGKPGFEGGNQIIRVYYMTFDGNIYGYSLPGYYIVEVTLVYADEDHPDPVTDELYDYLRFIEYGRWEDIETFFIVVKKSTGSAIRLSFIGIMVYWWVGENYGWWHFDGTYSRYQDFDDAGYHYSKKITSFSKTSGEHPIIYVNTWNHMMAEYDNNPGMSKTYYKTWQMSPCWGNRLKAEEDYTVIWGDHEELDESP